MFISAIAWLCRFSSYKGPHVDVRTGSIRIFKSFYDSDAREPKDFLIWRVFQLADPNWGSMQSPYF
jgi:hypothetical protein